MNIREILLSEEWDNTKYDQDTVWMGLNIVGKYLPKNLITGAEHDIIYGVDIDDLESTNITEEEVIELESLGWFYEEDCDCIAHFV